METRNQRRLQTNRTRRSSSLILQERRQYSKDQNKEKDFNMADFRRNYRQAQAKMATKPKQNSSAIKIIIKFYQNYLMYVFAGLLVFTAIALYMMATNQSFSQVTKQADSGMTLLAESSTKSVEKLASFSEGSISTIFKSENDNSVHPQDIAKVTGYLKRKFIGGDWFFQLAEAQQGMLHAYIQIPEALSMSDSQTNTYLKTAICPAQNDTNFWQNMHKGQFRLHLYTAHKNSSISAMCTGLVTSKAA